MGTWAVVCRGRPFSRWYLIGYIPLNLYYLRVKNVVRGIPILQPTDDLVASHILSGFSPVVFTQVTVSRGISLPATKDLDEETWCGMDAARCKREDVRDIILDPLSFGEQLEISVCHVLLTLLVVMCRYVLWSLLHNCYRIHAESVNWWCTPWARVVKTSSSNRFKIGLKLFILLQFNLFA